MLNFYGKTFSSRLLVGSALYPSPAIMQGAIRASGSQIVTVSLWHPDARSIVLVTLACASAVLVVHELAFPYALARVWSRRPA